ncbi:MAG: exodeoxyribonuclease V subunit gamma [Desulfobacterales bacterium]|nr:exodeoxyribonuclease V subunit gamma [Desulfobacterales bacterium]
MSGLNIFTSNKLEILADKLAQLIKTSGPPALAAEIIVVQSSGMARWISLELARYNSICANVRFPFPNTFLEEIAKQVLPDFREPVSFDPDRMTFKIMKVIPECIQLPGFERLKAYLAEDDGHLKRLQLSIKLADIYDQYQVFRPEMILQWEQGKQGADEAHPEDKWQAQLWRKLIQGQENKHRARLQRDLINQLSTEPAKFMNLPERVFIFGISYLPLFHIEAFAALSQHLELNLFLLNPCREYWGEIVSEKQMQRVKRKYPRSADITAELHLEQGNRLLASMGTHGKDFFAVISDFDFEMHEIYKDPECTDLLSCIQSDILNLRERKAAQGRLKEQGGELASPAPVLQSDNSDTSIQIHNCHSPMREIQALHDNLLAMFDEDPHLLPKDIVVMAPDIAVYAPYIQAAFATQPNERLRIPYSIADQSARDQGRLIDGFFSFLDLKGSRFSAARVMRLLESPGVKKKFGLRQTDIENIERWIRDTRIRWGIDGTHRQQMGLPAVSENTWSAGIKRLLLGYAMPGNNRLMFNGILPYDEVEGNEIHSFGKFLNFMQTVLRYAEDLTRPKQLQQWGALFKRLLDDLFMPDEETEAEIQYLRNIFDDLGIRQTQSAFDEKLEFESIRFYIGQRLDKLSFGSGFMTGGVTFCAMLPMRSIPFKVICLLGMNSDVFPRKAQPLTFDLVAKHPRSGDRSRRDDDKYLFLESIISARNKLYISYVGQSIQDNSRIPPSVLVSELLDTIEKGFELSEKNILEHLVTLHRLQAFSPQYFQKDSGLFSYSEENREAASFLDKNETVPPLITGALLLTPPEKEELHSLDIETLIRFFSNPIRFMLQQRLGIYLEETAGMVDRREDFELNFLDQYRVGRNLVDARMEGRDLNNYRPVQIAMGQLPHGNVGTFYYNELSSDVERFVSKIESLKDKKIAGPLEARIEMGESLLQARLPEIYNCGLLQVRYAKQRAQDLLSAWIYHLVLCEAAPKELPPKTAIIFKNAAWRFKPVDHHLQILMDLFNLFKGGLEKPLHFFPRSSLEYVQQEQLKSKSKITALIRARKKWQGSGDYARGESDDPYYNICFKMTDPIDQAFEDVSKAVFGPLLASITKMDL